MNRFKVRESRTSVSLISSSGMIQQQEKTRRLQVHVLGAWRSIKLYLPVTCRELGYFQRERGSGSLTSE